MAEAKKGNMDQEEKMHKQYDRLIKARNFHYENLNKWLITFYAIIGALFLALHTLHASEHLHRYMELCVAIVGYVVSLGALLSLKGYYYWEYHWIERLHRFERHVFHYDHDEMQVYSAFADKIKHDKPKRLIDSANVSTTKVSLFITVFIAVLWGMIVLYIGNNLWIELDRYIILPIAVTISFGSTWLMAWGGAKWLDSDLRGLDDLQNVNDNMETPQNKTTLNVSTILVIIAFVVIFLTVLCIWLFAYKPKFSDALSGNNADWGNFGDFFWGLGTMLFTGLNVVVLLLVNKQLKDYNDQQQAHQDDFKLRVIRQERLDYWIKEYHRLILKLTSPELKNDVNWLDSLRELTVIYQSILAEQDGFPQKVTNKINDTYEKIKIVILGSYGKKDLDKGYSYLASNFSLNMTIMQLYYDLIALNKSLPDINTEYLFEDKKMAISEGKEIAIPRKVSSKTK